MGEQAKTNKFTALLSSVLGYFLKVVFVTATAMIVGGMNLTLGLLFAGLFSLFYLLLSKQKKGAFFTPNFLFIPLIYRTLHTIDFTLFPNDYQSALGQLVVAFWIAGIVHILLAIIARYIPYRQLRKFFPPYLIGALIMALALIFIITISGQQIFVPLYENTTINFINIITIGVTIFIAFLIKNKVAQGNFLREAYFFFALIAGTLLHFLLESSAFFLEIGNGDFHFIDVFGSPSNLNWSTLTPLVDYEFAFGFLDNLDLNWSLIIAIIPLAIIGFFELFEAVKDNHRLVLQGELEPQDYDRLIFANGISIMLASTGGLSPFYAQKVYDQRMNKLSEIAALLTALVLVSLLSVWTWFTNLLLIIPSAAFQGMMIFAFMVIIGHGYAMIKVSLHEQTPGKNFIVAGVAGVVTLFFGLIDVINQMTGLSFLVLQIGIVQLDYLGMGLICGILVNIIIPRKHSSGEKIKNQE